MADDEVVAGPADSPFPSGEPEVPRGFGRVLETLERAGFQAWAVGGAIRDWLAGDLVGPGFRPRSGERETVDWDVATDARPEEVIALFRRTVPLGVEHGTVGVLEDGHVWEATTFRLDVETDGRHAAVEFASTIDEDLARRDFTINALAWRPATGEFRDPFGGRDDLENGVLRAVGEPGDRFAEDYLRVLRGLRFAGRFDLEIEPATREALIDAAAGLSRLSAERVREELMKVLSRGRGPRSRPRPAAAPTSGPPSTALDLYAECGVLDHWFPELVPIATDRAAWREHLGTVDAVPEHRPLLRLARLLVPLGVREPTAAGVPEATGVPGPRAGAEDESVARLMERLRFSNAERRTVATLVGSYLPFPSPLDSAAQIRVWLSAVEDRWRDLFRLHIGGARMGGRDWQRVVAASFRTVHAEVLARPPLAIGDLAIDGGDLLGLGLGAGPLVGLMLDELLEQVLEDPDRNERDALLAEAERLIELGALAGSPGGNARGGGGEDGSRV